MSNAITDRGFKFLNLTPNNVDADLIVSSIPGMLHTLTVNTQPAATGTFQLYDGADNTGTLIATITLPLGNSSEFVPNTFIWDLALATGLYVLGDGVISGFDFTVIYI